MASLQGLLVTMWCSPCRLHRRISDGAYQRFLHVLTTCGVSHDTVLPCTAPEDIERSSISDFSPLFTARFDFHHHRLSTLGDAVIEQYLSSAFLHYTAHHGLVLTVNTINQLKALLHNHFVLHLFSKQLQLDALVMDNSDVKSCAPSAAPPLAFLEPEETGISRHDVVGTSFHVTPLPAGQSPLGWKFSHFIGALYQLLGHHEAATALESLYHLATETNLPRCASDLALHVLEKYPVVSVAEALLAAQGIATRYTAKTRLFDTPLTDFDAEKASPTGRRDFSESTSQSPPTQELGSPLEVLGKFGVSSTDPEAINIDAVVSSREPVSELAKGPGLVNFYDQWKTRASQLADHRFEPPLPAESDSTSNGWLSTREQSKYRRGPAFANWVDFSACTTYADRYGLSQPVDGYIVRRKKFKKEVRDPLFYDKMSDMRNGVPFNTHGEPLEAYLTAFQTSHNRLFEVSMLAESAGESKLVGRSVASRYTVAREGACRAYMGGVLNDLLLMGQQSSSDCNNTGSSPA